MTISISAYTIARSPSTGIPSSISGNDLSLVPSVNGFGEATGMDTKILGTSKAAWTATYNNVGEINGKTETVSGGSTGATYVYHYTTLGQLDKVYKGGTLVEDYDYYPNGNRQKETINNVIRKFNYDNDDRLEETLTNANVQIAAYTHDTDGFLTTKVEAGVTTTYDYSSLGELREVTFSSGAIRGVKYDHDALGRRVAKYTKTTSGGAYTLQEKYLWAGMNQGLLAVYDAAGALKIRFEYAGGRLPVSMWYNSKRYYLTYDQVGTLRSVWTVTSGAAALQREIAYTAFGKILNASTMNVNSAFTVSIPFGFAGGMYDADTGLVRFGYRDYDPDTGRWTAKDPIGFTGGDLNLYGYVLSNPVSAIDTNGLWSIAIQGGFPFPLRLQLTGGNGQLGLSFGVGVGAGASVAIEPFETLPPNLATGCGGLAVGPSLWGGFDTPWVGADMEGGYGAGSDGEYGFLNWAYSFGLRRLPGLSVGVSEDQIGSDTYTYGRREEAPDRNPIWPVDPRAWHSRGGFFIGAGAQANFTWDIGTREDCKCKN